MLPIKKILWPTDFSEPSYVALNTAQELAKHFSAELTIVNVITPIPVVSSPNGPAGFDVSLYQDQIKETSNESLQDIIQKKISKEIKTQGKIVMGNAPDEIVKTAEEENADLIVIATHGETGWRHLVFGSVAEKVVRFATCPVLTIHQPKENK
ncbi:MAG: universal stress protein [Candidatus Aminicenantes bacterium]